MKQQRISILVRAAAAATVGLCGVAAAQTGQGLDQLIARREHRNARLAMDGERSMPHGGSQGDVAGIEAQSCLQENIAGTEIQAC